jgi:hypothetical protein
MQQLFVYGIALTLLCGLQGILGTASRANTMDTDARTSLQPVDGALWREAVVTAPEPGRTASSLLAHDAAAQLPVPPSADVIRWRKPTRVVGSTATFTGQPHHGPRAFVLYLFNPIIYRDHAFCFRVTASKAPILSINGSPVNGAYEDESTLVCSVPSHALSRAGLNRLVVEVVDEGEITLAMQATNPRDCKWLSAIPPALDSTRHRHDWPSTVITNGLVRARVALPHREKYYYRGHRFERAGAVTDLEYAGHRFFHSAGDIHDPLNTGLMVGPSEEYFQAIAWDDAQPGEPFIKIGVGLYEKAEQKEHAWYNPYWPVRTFPWTTRKRRDAITFTQTVAGPRGWGYRYVKRLSLPPNAPCLRIDYTFTNSGDKPIMAEQYAHNWVRFDDLPIGKGYRLSFPFTPHIARDVSAQVALSARQIALLTGDTTHMMLEGWQPEAAHNNVVISHAQSPLQVTMFGNFPLSQLALYFAKEAVCVEPFVRFQLVPGESYSWTREYTFAISETAAP